MREIREVQQELDVNELNRELEEELETLPLTEEQEETEERPSGKTGRRHHGKKRNKRKRKKKGRAFRVIVIILIILVLLLAGLVCAFFVLRSRGERQLAQSVVEETVAAPEEAELEDDGKYVVYKGERYCYNENIITILCMGVDKSMEDVSIENIGENGQADAVFLAVLDKSTGELSFVNISRDSMVDINLYNTEGQFVGTERMQLCLAYAYGDGRERSCENTAEAVSRLMYGMPINAYAAIDYSGISVLNDAVGGITVQVLEDLTEEDPELEAGKTVTLTGEQAHTYVRERDTSQLDSNNARMARQKQYLTAFLSTAINEIRSNFGLVLTLYQTAAEYMVTDIDTSELTYLASLVVQKGFSEGNMYSVPGEVVRGEQYAEFIPDDEALYELILDVFYEKV